MRGVSREEAVWTPKSGFESNFSTPDDLQVSGYIRRDFRCRPVRFLKRVVVAFSVGTVFCPPPLSLPVKHDDEDDKGNVDGEEEEEEEEDDEDEDEHDDGIDDDYPV